MGTIIRRKPTLTALLLGCLFSTGSQATSLEITPVAVHLVSGQNAATIEVMNRGGDSTAIQLRTYAWSQEGDKDLLTPTQSIILSPPIFTVPKGATQTIRLLLRRGPPTAGERSYRLLIDEVPSVNAKDQQVAIAMRVSLPVIIASASPKLRSLQWDARRGAGNRITLSATNRGNTYDRVHAIAVTLADGSHPEISSVGTNSYILAGARRQWVVQAGSAATRELRLSVTTQAGKSEQVLALAP